MIGLAWTPVGGEVLVIETVASAGTGKVILTGSLGNVIKESIQVALSFVRANARKYALDVSQLDKVSFLPIFKQSACTLLFLRPISTSIFRLEP